MAPVKKYFLVLDTDLYYAFLLCQEPAHLSNGTLSSWVDLFDKQAWSSGEVECLMMGSLHDIVFDIKVII
jgi:hypothetical protein